MSEEDDQKTEDIQKLVLARLESMPANIQVNLGDGKILDRDSLIGHVKKGDELGKKIIDVQMAYLKRLKEL